MAAGVRTKGMTANELMAHIATLELQIKDMMTILASIAFLQDDKMFSVSIKDMTNMPKGSSVEFSFNKKLDQYEFTYIPPPPEPSAGLILPLTADGEKAAALVRASAASDQDVKT
jgi:hypothetical protein